MRPPEGERGRLAIHGKRDDGIGPAGGHLLQRDDRPGAGSAGQHVDPAGPPQQVVDESAWTGADERILGELDEQTARRTETGPGGRLHRRHPLLQLVGRDLGLAAVAGERPEALH